MRDDEFESLLNVRHVIDAVPYPKFAEMIGKKPSAVKNMVDDGKLPIIPWKNPQSLGNRAENWVYKLTIPAPNRVNMKCLWFSSCFLFIPLFAAFPRCAYFIFL
ncbi:Cox family DNA-binding protein [Pantoea allii]|uniref:Cox family DNA-binding protein n=1 Tax=Pantoea allii TaxID=574096 RepID=UPI003D32284B